jgi:hypothetical protein
MKQNAFDQKEFGFCKNILKQKKWENPITKKLTMKVMTQMNNEYFRNEQMKKADVSL